MKQLPIISLSDVIRFNDKFVKSTDNACWNWSGSKSRSNRGMVRLNKTNYQAPRIAYYIAYSIDPYPLCVLHSCDNAQCVNPKHLFLGSHAENMRDMASKGRGKSGSLKGEKSFAAKLTNKKVLKIKKLWLTGKYTQKQIGKKFGVAHQNIWWIVNGKSWGHV